MSDAVDQIRQMEFETMRNTDAKIDIEYLKTVLSYENGKLYWKVQPAARVKVGDRVGYCNGKGYRHFEHKGISYNEHRVIWMIHNGEITDGLVIDHINRDKFDNRIENLRVVTQKENCENAWVVWTVKMEEDYQGLKTRRESYFREQLTKSGRWNNKL